MGLFLWLSSNLYPDQVDICKQIASFVVDQMKMLFQGWGIDNSAFDVLPHDYDVLTIL